MGNGFTPAVLLSLLQATVRMATPYTLAAIGGIYSDKAGVSSIELEGILLLGAFSGFTAASFSGSLWLGLLAAAVSGVLLAAVYGYMVVFLGSKSALVGTAVVLLASGLTSFYFRSLFGVSVEFPSITPFGDWKVPLLGALPLVGEILFRQNVLVYLSFLLVLATWFFFSKTALGLQCRAMGENPYAADTLGLAVRRYRFASVLLTGAIAGVAGACLSVAASGSFVEGMSAEKGYAAFAIIILGKYHPIGAFLGCLLYGFADALQLNLQAIGVDVPYQFMLMLPYLFTLAVMFVSGSGNQPEGHGTFFQKGGQSV
ncbi:ABC transporter permease [Pseudoflavonifractor sp. 524-17]|uniref:ABC transporter permease n=1 Tax=Pseudoflavonifractor sp. 524-17 TaxID=2304577 RepID=UPI0013794DA4|nr:ABC transporter permease [Pseudoflavonifractor sp. 524-17]NCE64860.1 ABC transporter permease [Pseudoflavonifractor sp. 524-17]